MMRRTKHNARGFGVPARLGMERLEGRQMMTQLVEHLGVGMMCDAPVIGGHNGEDAVYFSGNTSWGCYSRLEYEALWRTDGTADGTVALGRDSGETIYADTVSEIDGQLYFGILTNGKSDHHVLVTDGTSTRPFSEYSRVVAKVNNHLLYSCYHCVDGDSHLMSFDGESSVPLWGQDSSGRLNPENKVLLGDRVFFGGRHLWRSDGTVEGTEVLHTTSGESDDYRDTYRIIGKVGSSAFYFWATGASGRELWLSDGTVIGTVRVQDSRLTEAQESTAIIWNDSLLVMTGDRVGNGFLGLTPLLIRGTDTTQLRENQLLITEYRFQTAYHHWNDKLVYFVGQELLATDGTEQGTKRLHRILPNSRYSTDRMMHTDRFLYFEGPRYQPWDASHPVGQIYRSDGIETQRLGGTDGRLLAVTDDLLIYRAGREVLTLADDESEPVRFEDRFGIEAGTFHTTFSNGDLLFTASGEEQRRFWTTDGTRQGTGVYSDYPTITHDDADEYVVDLFCCNQFIEFEDMLIFQAYTADSSHLFSMPTPAALERNSDVNSDGVVDSIDFLVLQEHFGTTEAGDAQGDIDDDGVIDFTDYLLLSRVIDQAKRT